MGDDYKIAKWRKMRSEQRPKEGSCCIWCNDLGPYFEGYVEHRVDLRRGRLWLSLLQKPLSSKLLNH